MDDERKGHDEGRADEGDGEVYGGYVRHDGEHGTDDAIRQDDTRGDGEHVQDDGRYVWDDKADVGAHGTGNEKDAVAEARTRLFGIARRDRASGESDPKLYG